MVMDSIKFQSVNLMDDGDGHHIFCIDGDGDGHHFLGDGRHVWLRLKKKCEIHSSKKPYAIHMKYE